MEDGEIVEAVVMEETLCRNGKSSFMVLHETKTAIEELVSEMLSIKTKSTPKSSLSDLVTQMCLLFVSLRQVNRSILVEEDRVKAETERAKAPVDFTTLQLHNLMYEKSYYLKGIKACKDFKSKYPDIELVSEDEFLRDAPDHIRDVTLSDDVSHNMMLQRLNYELHQRKELFKMKEDLEKTKKTLLETITNRKKFLSSLPSHLKSLKKASLPVQGQLGILHSKKLKQQSMAELLPPPLYVIFSQLLAQKEAFGENIDLEIVGNLKDALNFARQQANKDSGNHVENMRSEEDVADEEDDGQRRRKRSKKAPSSESLGLEGINLIHPLKVILQVYDSGEAFETKSSKLIAVKFEYFVKLNIVCAAVEGSHEGSEDIILCNLFPDDSGVELPHQFAKVSVGDSNRFNEDRISRPYKWVQHLAGIDFLPEVAPLLADNEISNSDATKHAVVSGLSLYRQQNRVLTVVQRIRSRKKAQLSLMKDLESLGKLKWPSLSCESVFWALSTPSCILDSWYHATSRSHVLPMPIGNSDRAKEIIDLNLDAKVDSSKEETQGNEEDGELPSNHSVSFISDPTSAHKGICIDHSNQLNFLSKSILSPISKGKSLSFKKHDDDTEMLLDGDSDADEHGPKDSDSHNVALNDIDKNSWIHHGDKEYYLILSKNLDTNGKLVKLEAKVIISMEYPIRPPLFSLNIYTMANDGSKVACLSWLNDIHAMEAEVNVYLPKHIPTGEANNVLAHQIRCLAILFDYLLEEESPGVSRTNTSIVDVGLGNVAGHLLPRSLRGRDRRRIIAWKEMACSWEPS